MMNICETGPNNAANFRNSDLEPGQALVIIGRSGKCDTFSRADTDDVRVTHLTQVHPTLDESHPELANSMANCNGPSNEKVAIKGLRGLFGLRKARLLTECPALALHVDVHSAKVVEEYFGSNFTETIPRSDQDSY